MIIFIHSISLERAATKEIMGDSMLPMPPLGGYLPRGDATVARYTLKGKDTDFNPYGCLDVGCWVTGGQCSPYPISYGSG